MPEFDSIFFDFDGVLLDSEPVHCACWAEVLAAAGRHPGRGNITAIAASGSTIATCCAPWQRPGRPAARLGGALGAIRQEEGAVPLADDRRAALPDTIGGLLESLDGRYRLAVVSSSSCVEIEPLLEAGGLRHFFQTIVGGGDVTRQKPDPEPYLLAAKRLGSKRALVLEDSAAGIGGRAGRGFRSDRGTAPDRSSGAAARAAGHRNLRNYIGRL